MYIQRCFGVLAAALLVPAAARAGDSGFYLGASVGEATESSIGFDGSDTAFRLLGGYSFSKYFSVEAGYVDAGKLKDSAGPYDLSLKSDGYFATGLAKLPLGKIFAPYVKLGYVVYDSTSAVSNGSNSASETISDEDLLYGVGGEFRLGDNLRVRIDYEKVDVPDAAFDIYSVFVTYQF